MGSTAHFAFLAGWAVGAFGDKSYDPDGVTENRFLAALGMTSAFVGRARDKKAGIKPGRNPAATFQGKARV
jgi:hypothetical protein